MIEAFYSVVRFNPDPARDEPRNIGIVLWDGYTYRLQIDGEAVDRAVRAAPNIQRDSLFHIERLLLHELDSPNFYDPGEFGERVRQISSSPIELSDPRSTLLGDDSRSTFDEEFVWLMNRMVRLSERFYANVGSYRAIMARKLSGYIKQQYIRLNYPVPESKSGVQHTVDFYVNSSANLAVDTVGLALSKGDAIKERAQSRAFKVSDIVSRNPGMDFYTVCQFAERPPLHEANENARSILVSSGAKILTDPDEAVKLLTQSALPLVQFAEDDAKRR